MNLFNRLADMLGLSKPPAIVSISPTAKDPVQSVETPRVVVNTSPSIAVSTSTNHNGNGPTIAVVNQSTVLRDADIVEAVAALQIQVDRDFEPVWELGANIVFVSSDQIIPENAWVIYLLDHSDQQGALGYHDLTNNGLPVAKVFAGDDLQYNLSWTVTLSHELLEMLLDPYINNTVFVQQSNTSGVLFAYEVCDSVEDDSFGYKINDVLVSDFVYPAWFRAGASSTEQFSHGGHVHRPFEIAQGGYIGYFEVSSSSTGWQQATGQGGPGQRLMSKMNRVGSRFNKRVTHFFDVPSLGKKVGG